MKTLVALCILCTGCVSKYEFTRTVDGVTSTLSVSTVRKFDSLAVKYNADTRAFELDAQGVQTDTAALATALQALALIKLQPE